MRLGGVSALLIAAAGASGVAAMRPRLAEAVHEVKQRDDVYTLPPPSELRVMTLGYDAAATDLIWSTLLVEYGTHWYEHRAFEDTPRYLEAVFTLEPDFPPLYKFADTLLVYRPPVGTEADARLARMYLERGAREIRPLDHDVWLEYGQFVAFTGPSFLTSPEERDSWRRDGAKAIARAVELGADPDRSLAAATILSRYGERETAIAELERIRPLADDPGTREQIDLKLQLLRESVSLGDFMTKDEIMLAQMLYPDTTAIRERVVAPGLAGMNEKLGHEADAAFLTSAISYAIERARADQERVARYLNIVETDRRKEFPFLSRGEFLMIAPERDAARCIGRASVSDPSCAPDWTEYLQDAQSRRLPP